MDMDDKYFEPLPYGYKCYTGHVLPDIHVDSINALTERLRKRVDAGFPLTQDSLNQRHRVFNMYARAATDFPDNELKWKM